jgi:hypothetical protein
MDSLGVPTPRSFPPRLSSPGIPSPLCQTPLGVPGRLYVLGLNKKPRAMAGQAARDRKGGSPSVQAAALPFTQKGVKGASCVIAHHNYTTYRGLRSKTKSRPVGWCRYSQGVHSA